MTEAKVKERLDREGRAVKEEPMNDRGMDIRQWLEVEKDKATEAIGFSLGDQRAIAVGKKKLAIDAIAFLDREGCGCTIDALEAGRNAAILLRLLSWTRRRDGTPCRGGMDDTFRAGVTACKDFLQDMIGAGDAEAHDTQVARRRMKGEKIALSRLEEVTDAIRDGSGEWGAVREILDATPPAAKTKEARIFCPYWPGAIERTRCKAKCPPGYEFPPPGSDLPCTVPATVAGGDKFIQYNPDTGFVEECSPDGEGEAMAPPLDFSKRGDGFTGEPCSHLSAVPGSDRACKMLEGEHDCPPGADDRCMVHGDDWPAEGWIEEAESIEEAAVRIAGNDEQYSNATHGIPVAIVRAIEIRCVEKIVDLLPTVGAEALRRYGASHKDGFAVTCGRHEEEGS